MHIIYHDELEGASPYPGLTRTITMDQQYGAAAITQGMVTLEAGATIRPHTHLVEESITVLEGDVRLLVGDEIQEVRGRRLTVLAPANTVHGMRNIGDAPVVLCIAYPSVGVASFPVNVEF